MTETTAVLTEPDDRVRLALSPATIAIVLDALSRLRAAEVNNLQLGPGSRRIVNALAKAEAELRDQLPAGRSANRLE